jgi:hypothetical protein
MFDMKMMHSLLGQRFEYLVHNKDMTTEARLEASLELISFVTDFLEVEIKREEKNETPKKT